MQGHGWVTAEGPLEFLEGAANNGRARLKTGSGRTEGAAERALALMRVDFLFTRRNTGRNVRRRRLLCVVSGTREEP